MATTEKTPVALCTVAGKQALAAYIDMPEWGAWTASFDIDADVAPPVGELVDIVLAPQADGLAKVLLLGTVRWSAAWQGRSRLEVIGGAGGLVKLLPARAYRQGPVPIQLGTVLADLVGEAGESLADGVQSTLSVDPYTLPQWVRAQGTALTTLARLCKRFSLVWRVLDDGTIFVGPRAYPDDAKYANANPESLAADDGLDGQQRVITTAPDAATIRPGTTVLGRHVMRVVYMVGEDGMRADLYYPDDVGNTDRDEEEQDVRRLLPELPYAQGYAATITAIRAGGRVEVRADDVAIGEADGVILMAGTPHMKVDPVVGQRVRLHFSAADPRLAYATAWEQDLAANRGVARAFDNIQCGTLSVVAPPGGGACTLTFTPDFGDADVGASVYITGKISSGHPRIALTSEGQ